LNSGKESNPTVAVLLPTFNGAMFLQEQLLSINSQIGVEVRVYINDDGSTDGSLQIIEKFMNNGHVYKMFKSNRIGSTQAFFRLLEETENETYIAFCDQDDIWDPEKLQKSVQILEREGSQMVFTSREYIDAKGKTIGFSPRIRKKPGLRNALVENIAYGNTQMICSEVRKAILSIGAVPVKHFDSWVYLIVCAAFKISFLDLPLTKYRIHSDNQIGVRGRFDFRRATRGLHDYYLQNRILLQSNLADIDQATISAIENHMLICDSRSLRWFFNRSRFIAYRHRRLDQFLMRLVLPFSSGAQK
jgi:glycosyltransferase involved in cell wall biosynthesis